jgi:hypothetical protein
MITVPMIIMGRDGIETALNPRAHRTRQIWLMPIGPNRLIKYPLIGAETVAPR